MSNCIKDLYDYSSIEECSKCGLITLKSNFHERILSRDGLCIRCKVCKKEYFMENFLTIQNNYLDNRDKFSIRHKEYQVKNHEKANSRKKLFLLLDKKQISILI